MSLGQWPELPSEALGTWARFYISLGVIAAINLLFGLLSHFIKSNLFLSEALVALLAGIAFGPQGLDLIFRRDSTSGNLLDLARIFYHTSRLVLSLQTMAAGVSLPRSYVFRHWQSLLLLLGPLMLLMWLTSSLLVWLLFSKYLNITEAFLLGACITPTDPVLVNSIVRGRYADMHVPGHLRTLISAESGANDGAALPLLMLPLLILVMSGPRPISLLSLWFTHVWLYQIFLSVLIGVAVGFGARKALQYAEYHGLIDRESFLVFSLALALALTGIVTLTGSNDLLATFVAGVVFAWDDWFLEATREARIQEVVDSVFNLSFFVYFGTAVPWEALASLSWERLLVGACLILALRRMPATYALRRWIPELRSRREALFVGWFGPIGVGAIFYSSLVTIDWSNAAILPIVWFLVMASVVAHGVTVPLIQLLRYSCLGSRAEDEELGAGRRSLARIARLIPGAEEEEGEEEEEEMIGDESSRRRSMAGPQHAPTPPTLETDLREIAKAITESHLPLNGAEGDM